MLSYQIPPKPIADIIDAPRMPGIAFSPDGSQLALMDLPGLPGIEELAAAELRLAGLRINPRTNGPSRAVHFHGLRLMEMTGRVERRVTGLPEQPRLRSLSFSPNGNHIALTHTRDDGIELWIVDVLRATASQLSNVRINDVYGAAHAAIAWLSDSKHVLCRVVPDGRGEPPAPPAVPPGPEGGGANLSGPSTQCV